MLVARQMGKTNLLFNAKRTLENNNRLFAYIDLSNLYNSERDCYRNIINNIIEPNLDLLGLLEEDINEIRAKNLPPHNEYSRSLVKILNFLEGDLVIILDEIDALKSVDYSDNIFAQIRSNYFSRTNYPVLERLTYVLSGVIEPTELIKDKNKSPFNIGEKIYLDDFTKEEHDKFIIKSKLQIPEKISEEVFKWTNGNPRLTFDICAEIENKISSINQIEESTIQNIIKGKYLTNYDVAPIDHIRELVRSNRDIRKAIIQIHNKNFKDIGDEIKQKLYLYGIINSKFNEDTTIKNEIIAQSLSDNWVKSVDKDYSFVYGLTKYSEKDYKASIDILLSVLSETKSLTEIDGSNYFLGMSYLKIGDYKNAIIYFSHPYKDVKYKNDSYAYLGVCKMAIGELEEGISILEESIKIETNTHAYHNALLNLAVNINDDEKALPLFQKLYDSTFESDNSNQEEVNQLKALSLYYQGEILERSNDIKGALDKIDLALTFSSISDSISLLRTKFLLQTIKDDTIKRELVNKIIDNKLTFNEDDSYPINFSENAIYLYLDLVYDRHENTLFNQLLDYTASYLLKNNSKSEIQFKLGQISIINKQIIFEQLIEDHNQADQRLTLNTYRELLYTYSKDENKFLKSFPSYKKLFEQQTDLLINDIYLYAVAVRFNSNKRHVEEAINLCKDIESRLEVIENTELRNESIIIFYWLSHLYFGLKHRSNSIFYAEKTLSLISEATGKKMSMIDESGLKVMADQLNQIKASSTIISPIINKVKYGRNDWIKVRYLDGKELEKKYKVLEPDILAGRCEIISSKTNENLL